MDRTVPKTGGEEIQLYMRTYYSLLRSTDSIQIETLVESHLAMDSSLHEGAHHAEPDMSAFLYSLLRLPPCAIQVKEILLGQMEKSFVKTGYADVADWERVYAPGRRRRTHFDGTDKLAVYIVSRSDIDDLVPILTAYQIEWNKLHRLLQNGEVQQFLKEQCKQPSVLQETDLEILADLLQMDRHDLQRLNIVWQDELLPNLQKIADGRKKFSLRLLSGSLADYRRATASWWDELHERLSDYGIDLSQRSVYFVSSNTHSLVNLLAGFARRYEESLIAYIESCDYKQLVAEYRDIRDDESTTHKSMDNFLYYVLKTYLSETGHEARAQLEQDERRVGIHRISSQRGFEIETQFIEIGKLHTEWFDGRIQDDLDLSTLIQSDALIINMDYPLGMAAYELLSQITSRVGQLAGVYILGKAATLNGRIGDVMIPNVIHDEHSQNTFLIHNCFSARDVRSYMAHGNVLDNQKAITVLGTFLQNPNYMSVIYHEGYTDIEMEGGPYLSAVYEAHRPKRHPVNEIVNLHEVPFDVGFLHYASDTPMKKGQNLGAGNLSFGGVEPTYATAIAVLRRIFQQEKRRLKETAKSAGMRELVHN